MQEAWEDRLALVRTEAEVIDLANEFLFSLDRFEVIQLPAACKPRKLGSTHDVMGYAFDVLHYRSADNVGVGLVLGRLSKFFAAASHRLARLSAPVRRYTDAELGLVPRGRRNER